MIKQNGGQMADFHEVITYQIIPEDRFEEAKIADLKKLFYIGPVYKSTLIGSAIEKGEFVKKDLKEHLAFEVTQKDEHLNFPFLSAKIKYT